MLLVGLHARVSFAGPGADAPFRSPKGVKQMTSIFGMALLPLWIMGAP